MLDAAVQKYAISIHALRGEGDAIAADISGSIRLFQSTPSVGRATLSVSEPYQGCGFQSTPSVGRATICSKISYNKEDISIHALRGEGDIISPVLSR